MPAVPITLFTDQRERRPIFDSIVPIEGSGAKAYRDKLLWMGRSPYDQTLFLDTDTYVCDDVSELFDLLGAFDMALTHDRAFRDNFPPDVGVPHAFREFNTGVVVYRRTPETGVFFDECLRLYDELARRPGTPQFVPDQMPFRVAAFHSRLRIATLTFEYNCRFPYFGYTNGRVKLLHGREFLSSFSAPELERLAAGLNVIDTPRVYVAGDLYALHPARTLFSRRYAPVRVARLFIPYWKYCRSEILRRLKDHGWAATVSQLKRKILSVT